MTDCFWLERTDLYERNLRRFAWSNNNPCPLNGSHTASTLIDVVPAPNTEDEGSGIDEWPHDEPHWPTQCACGYVFREFDEWQVSCHRLYQAPDGTRYAVRDIPPGGMYESRWLTNAGWVGADGRSISVVLPDGTAWCIDSRASNCTMPDDREHRCWVRHGYPPKLTVDKNGLTCAAGAGSIGTPHYHGFLRDGVLT